ncbi:MAG: MerR family transcriptional regulator [Eggerthella lenta]
MKSSELAKLAGVSVRTLRHYHAIGLLPEPPRGENGYRDYHAEDLVRLLRVKRLSSLGFSLSRIGEVLDEMDANLAEASGRHADEASTSSIASWSCRSSACKSSAAPSRC